jgi:hypothetical protein
MNKFLGSKHVCKAPRVLLQPFLVILAAVDMKSDNLMRMYRMTFNKHPPSFASHSKSYQLKTRASDSHELLTKDPYK